MNTDSKFSKHPGLRVFTQHGFRIKGESSGSQVFGNCVFCGHRQNFYLNPEKKMWDCKSCGKHGGFKTFLQACANSFATNFTKYKESAKALSENRGISIETLIEKNIGYNPYNKSYTIPIPTSNMEEIWDLKVYSNKKLSISAGCFTGLYGWENLLNAKSTEVWLCEGEWDGIALYEIMKREEKSDVVCAVPGAGTFRGDWVSLFKGKNVKVMYDNDDAGKNGCDKVRKMLSGAAKSLQFLIWPEELKNGYDVRDFYIDNKNNAKRTLSRLTKYLSNSAPNGGTAEEESEKTTIKFEGPGLLPAEVHTVFQKWLKLESPEVIDVVAATIIANRWDGDPSWLLLVAPSGGVKTELLMSLDSCEEIVSVSDVTPHSLVSGAQMGPGGDPSLIPKLDRKNLILKDLTVLLSRNEQEREQVFSIFRDAYDRKLQRQFGNGVYRNYDAKFGFIAGVTPIIEMFTEKHASLGERFYRYLVQTPKSFIEQKSLIRKAIENSGGEVEMRNELMACMKKALDYDFGTQPEVPNEITEMIIGLAKWTSVMRATVIREHFTKEITHSPIAEVPTRLAKQLYKHHQAIAAFRRKRISTMEEYLITKKIAIDTAPSRLEKIVRAMYTTRNNGVFSIAEICKFSNLPTQTTIRMMENLQVLRVVDKEALGTTYNYRFTDEMIKLMELTQLYPKGGHDANPKNQSTSKFQKRIERSRAK
jgi:Toprim-like